MPPAAVNSIILGSARLPQDAGPMARLHIQPNGGSSSCVFPMHTVLLVPIERTVRPERGVGRTPLSRVLAAAVLLAS